MTITIEKKLIGGRKNPAYERLYKERIKKGDKIVLYISKEGKIKGSAIVVGDYFYDESIIWPPRDGEVWPHRRRIEIERIYEDGAEPDIRDFYSDLNLLEKARKENKDLGKTFGNFIRGLTPKRISKHDYLLLLGMLTTFRLSELDRITIAHLIGGKHIIFYGPPGTGTTRQAIKITKLFCGERGFSFQTANAEWTAYDVVGGPTLAKEATLRIKPGFLTLAAKRCSEYLEKYKRPYWLIIDEINRANLDLSFGKVFSLLDIEYRDQPIFDESELEGMINAKEYKDIRIPPQFRILATMNTYDIALLFSLGYAFRRRFAFIEIPSPFAEKVEDKYELNVDGWRNLRLLNETLLQEIVDEIDKWISVSEFLDLPEDIIKNLGYPDDFDMKKTIQDLNNNILNGGLDPYNPYKLACYLSEWTTKHEIVEIGYAQAVDLIKYTLVYSSLFVEEDLKVTIVKAMDESVKAYFIPHLEYYLPRARRMMTIGGGEEEKEILAKLEELKALVSRLSLIKSEKCIQKLITKLRMGETRMF